MFGYGLLHIEKQLVQRSRPGLLELFINESQLSKEMAVTQAMSAGKLKIGCPAIVNKGSLVSEQNAEGCNSFAPSLGMNTVPGDQFRADDVEPVEFLVYPHAGFIGVRDRRLPDVLDDGFVEGNERQSSGVNSGLDGRIAHSLPKEVCAHLANALHRQELLNGEIGKPCEEAHTILHGGVYAFRPWGMHLLSRLWTYLNFDNMLGNVEFLQRQVEDLSSF